jgi:UDP-N-acetylmuramate--alanine ligase
MHIYFLAIGGAGIGPLAQIAHEAGHQVSGSDQQNSSYIDYLKARGITDITIGDSVEVIGSAQERSPIDWLVYSSAVSMNETGQKQLEAAKNLGIKCTKRDDFINYFITENNLQLIAVAGTQGKTTTTAMLAWLFTSLNIPISYLVPAKISFGEMGTFNKDSKYFIYEADEYDRNFLSFAPKLSVITGVSWDHHEIYPTREDYKAAFNDFLNKSQQTVIWSSDVEYLNTDNKNLLVQKDDQEELSQIKLKGQFNRRDGWLAVVSLTTLLGVSVDQALDIINQFPGLSRRMEQIYPGLYSDYAHTPEKIQGAISAASEIAAENGKHLIVIYEPLTNRRQIHMIDEYKDSFKGADHVYWLPSYLAREDPKDQIVTPEELINKLTDPNIAEPAERNEQLLQTIKEHLDAGDMVVAMAGGGGNSLDDWLRQNFKTDQ